MNRITNFILVGVALSGISFPAIALPTVDVKTDYYQVSGNTAQKIRTNLNEKSPAIEQGESFDARTTWYVKWRFLWDNSDGKCVINKVKTTVDVQYILPKLKTSKHTPNLLKQKWKTYMEALIRHEKGHKKMGVNAASEIEQKIQKMSARSTCKQLEADANDLGDEIIKKYHILEKEFDRKTNHGMGEGAVFP
jgi:predicted secreted Zn-dependent protease